MITRLFHWLLLYGLLYGAPTLSEATTDAAPPVDVSAGVAVDLYVFWGEGCPHCEDQKPFLRELEADYPNLTVHEFEVWRDARHRPLFQRMAGRHGVIGDSVPTLFVGGWAWVGDSRVIRQQIRQIIEQCSRVACPDSRGGGVTPAPGPEMPATASPGATVLNLPWLGEIDLRLHPLLLSTTLIAFIDGFNPCSLWVLTLLLALVIHSGSRQRIALVGTVFLTVTALVYGLFITGLFGVLFYVSYLWWIQLLVAGFALLFAAVNIKDYFWYKRGLSFTIAEHHKPGIYQGIRRIMNRSGWGLVSATAIMALGVALVELPCTAGFPVIWGNLLVVHETEPLTFAGLLGVYLLIYLLLELVLFIVVLTTLRIERFEERHGRVLKLIGGMIMLALALVLIFRPELMNSVTGSLGVFGLALLAALLVVVVHHIYSLRWARQSTTPP